MKIFWSWQSDTPGNTGRYLIRDALKAAIEKLKLAPDIEEPSERASREALHLDYDIQGVLGSPDLAQTIFRKIDVSRVVIADVTAVGITPARKKLINSNVAIEVGYALDAIGDDGVILVFNKFYGTHEDLPFNLRHKGGAVTYDLPPDANSKRIEEERKKLIDWFAEKLKPYLHQKQTRVPEFPRTASTFSSAAYFAKGEPLAEVGEPEDKVNFSYAADTLCYLRVIPVSSLSKPIPLASLLQAASRVPLFNGPYSALKRTNRYGAIAFEPGSNPQRGEAKLVTSAQLFPNGEIWLISAELVITERGERPEWVKLCFIPSAAFEEVYIDALRQVLTFRKERLSLDAPLDLEMGLTGIEGLFISMPSNNFWGPIRKSEVVVRISMNETGESSIDDALLSFFGEIYDATGHPRPPNYNGFPPR